jgi:glycerophosphoryl diester phosphodiesterase
MSLSWRTPIVFAHRGASAYTPENTIAAFELAIQQNADVIELDTKLSADEYVVVIHDQTIDRTTNGQGRVKDFTLAALKELDAGSHYDESYHGEAIPTLDEAFASIGMRILINIELTNYSSPFDSLPEKVAQLISRHALYNQILVSSFHPIPLRHFQNLSPSIPIGLLAKPGLLGAISRSWIGKALIQYQAMHPEKSDVTQEYVYKVHQAGQRVHTYTVNSPEEIKKLLSLGVDGIITDDPIAARRLIDAKVS